MRRRRIKGRTLPPGCRALWLVWLPCAAISLQKFLMRLQVAGMRTGRSTEFSERVFNGGAGEGKAVCGFDPAGTLRGERGGVLDRLGLIEKQELKLSGI